MSNKERIKSQSDIIFMHRTLDSFIIEAKGKFNAGAFEHGGSIFDRETIQEARKEVMDLMFYLGTLKEKKEHLMFVVGELENQVRGFEDSLDLWANETEYQDNKFVNQIKDSVKELKTKIENL